MLKKTITYENPFTEQQVTEEHYFHISKANLVEMELEEHDATYTNADGEELTGMQAKLQRISDSRDGKAILAELKDIIRRAYGKKEGDRFLKSKEVADNFMASEAFSQLLFDLCTDAGNAAQFVEGIVPSNLNQIAGEVQAQAETIAAGRAAQEQAKASAATPEGDNAQNGDPTGLTFTEETTPRVLTSAEVAEMDSDELKSGLATGRYKLS